MPLHTLGLSTLEQFNVNMRQIWKIMLQNTSSKSHSTTSKRTVLDFWLVYKQSIVTTLLRGNTGHQNHTIKAGALIFQDYEYLNIWKWYYATIIIILEEVYTVTLIYAVNSKFIWCWPTWCVYIYDQNNWYNIKFYFMPW